MTAGRPALGRFGLTVTLSPGFGDAAALRAFARAGATRFRVNLSHVDPPALDAFCAAADRVAREDGLRLPLVLDLQGAKLRLGDFPAREVAAGETVRFVHAATAGGGDVPVPREAFFRALVPGAEVRIQDGKIVLTCVDADGGTARLRVVKGGPLASRRGVNLPGVAFRAVSADEVRGPLGAAANRGFPLEFALSFARTPDDLRALRDAAPGIPVVAKFETVEAFAGPSGLADLLAVADESWLCRGDLGAEGGLPALPDLEARYRRAAAESGRPWTLAGEVLHPLGAGDRLTRTEFVYLAGLRRDGASGIVLSDETIRSADPFALVAEARAFLDGYDARNS